MAISGLQGEVSVNAIQPLVLGAPALWSSGAAQTLYTLPSNANGLVVFHVVARGAVGTQPLSFSVAVGGVVIATGLSLSGIGAQQYASFMPTSGILTLPQTGSITATPLNASNGASCLFDLFGYMF